MVRPKLNYKTMPEKKEVLEKLECPGFHNEIRKGYEPKEGPKTPCWVVMTTEGTKSKIEKVLCPNLAFLNYCRVSTCETKGLKILCPYTQ
jgi:hypothetical protein